jgi:hypothetical protein
MKANRVLNHQPDLGVRWTPAAPGSSGWRRSDWSWDTPRSGGLHAGGDDAVGSCRMEPHPVGWDANIGALKETVLSSLRSLQPSSHPQGRPMAAARTTAYIGVVDSRRPLARLFALLQRTKRGRHAAVGRGTGRHAAVLRPALGERRGKLRPARLPGAGHAGQRHRARRVGHRARPDAIGFETEGVRIQAGEPAGYEEGSRAGSSTLHQLSRQGRGNTYGIRKPWRGHRAAIQRVQRCSSWTLSSLTLLALGCLRGRGRGLAGAQPIR